MKFSFFGPMNFLFRNILGFLKKNYIIKNAKIGKDFENLLKNKIKENGY